MIKYVLAIAIFITYHSDATRMDDTRLSTNVGHDTNRRLHIICFIVLTYFKSSVCDYIIQHALHYTTTVNWLNTGML